jgi:2-polyprenyl-3-methyl-5-hydroxy-6-metoxy-1,4-benzoquinol methylase
VTIDELTCPLCRASVPNQPKGRPPLYDCRRCRTAFVWPQPTPAELAKLYDQDTDPAYLSKYTAVIEARAAIYERVARENSVTGRLLDIGCGTGQCLGYFKDKGWTVSGTDWSPKAVEHCREQLGIEVTLGDFMTLESGEPRDCISAQHVLEHVLDPIAFLRKVRDQLVPGGLLFLAVPNHGSLIRNLVEDRWVCRSEVAHLFHFTRNSLRHLAVTCGFEMIAGGTLQFEMADLLWALKSRIMGRKPTSGLQSAGGPGTDRSVSESKPGSFRRWIVALAEPLRPVVEKVGLGSEIVAILRKPLKQGQLAPRTPPDTPYTFSC